MVVGGGFLDVAGGAAVHGGGGAEAALVVALVAPALVAFFGVPVAVVRDFGAAGGLGFVGGPVGAVLFVTGGDADGGGVEAEEELGAAAGGGLVEVQVGVGAHRPTPRLIGLLLSATAPLDTLRPHSNVDVRFRCVVM